MDLRKIKAIESANKKKLLAIFPHLIDDCGIYILYRFENGFKYAYVGQAKRILTRLAEHLKGYQHIDLSIKKHGLWSEENPTGWNVSFIKCPEDELDGKEQFYIQECAKAGYQLRNKTAGGQGEGKMQIDEYRPAKGYIEGLKKGSENLRKELKHIIERYLIITLKKNNKSSQKALEKFNKLLEGK